MHPYVILLILSYVYTLWCEIVSKENSEMEETARNECLMERLIWSWDKNIWKHESQNLFLVCSKWSSFRRLGVTPVRLSITKCFENYLSSGLCEFAHFWSDFSHAEFRVFENNTKEKQNQGRQMSATTVNKYAVCSEYLSTRTGRCLSGQVGVKIIFLLYIWCSEGWSVAENIGIPQAALS